jgi:hypothetical protein
MAGLDCDPYALSCTLYSPMYKRMIPTLGSCMTKLSLVTFYLVSEQDWSGDLHCRDFLFRVADFSNHRWHVLLLHPLLHDRRGPHHHTHQAPATPQSSLCTLSAQITCFGGCNSSPISPTKGWSAPSAGVAPRRLWQSPPIIITRANPVYAVLWYTDQRVLNILVGSMTKGLLGQMVGRNTSSAIWSYLTPMFLPRIERVFVNSVAN